MKFIDAKGEFCGLGKNGSSRIVRSESINEQSFFRSLSLLRWVFVCTLAFSFVSITTAQGVYPQNQFAINQPGNNFMAKSSTFRQEIARLEINVVRGGKPPLSITQVPRLEKDDVIKIRMLDELVNGVKPDQSNFDWTLTVAYVNPGKKTDSAQAVSEEINFRKKGWYNEHSFVVPYDSQPIFFLYPKPQYRSKILRLINKNKDDVRKIGEKTLEIADAYGKIGMFLTELQGVVNRNYYRNQYNNYPSYGSYNGGYGNNRGYGESFVTEQAIERIAKSFNIQLPGCWGNGTNLYNQPGYNPYNNGGYYNNNNNNNFYNNQYQFGAGNDLMGRIQCVARSVRVEDFDISVGRMLQQGGVFVAAQLAEKYPQLAFWINIAATALDLIIKITNKAPLKIIPTVVSAIETPNFSSVAGTSETAKISLFAESQPGDIGFVTAYPLVFHKWQANTDPEKITLPMPVLMDSCLHTGQNVIRTTDVLNDWMTDNFTKNFKLNISSPNGFNKSFNLKKNVGFGGWELMLSKEELDTIPKINLGLEAKIVGKRGFNTIESPEFPVQLSSSENWSVDPASQRSFTVGGKRTVSIKNQSGNCRCLESVVFKPASGGEFVFEPKSMTYSPDGKEVSFEINTKDFPSGSGQLDLRQFGGETVRLSLNVHPAHPVVSAVRLSKGDSHVVIAGERIEQVKAIRINGRRALHRPDAIDYDGNQRMQTGIAPTGGERPVPLERTFNFENAGTWQDSDSFSVELELDAQRILPLPNLFPVSIARPVLTANNAKEIEGFILSSANEMTATPAKNRVPILKNQLLLDYGSLPLFPIEVDQIGVNIQNALTDFDFKIEDLRIETRIENTSFNPIRPAEAEIEVLDWRSIRLIVQLSEQTRKMLGGRRIQFRIIDSRRGNSDWYSISQTFARVPNLATFRCANKECEITGKGLNYIQQLSLDDGKTWFPQSPTGVVPKALENGMESLSIPDTTDARRSVKIRLRDFPGEILTLNTK